MIGKKNIVFGFFYLVLTAALGPAMVIQHFDDVHSTQVIKKEKLAALQQAQASEFEVDLEKLNAEQIAKANTDALLALSANLNSQAPIDAIKGGPHSHGNLEAILNILVGILLLFLAVPAAFKQSISWLFIAGTVLHSGLLYLAVGLGWPWAGDLLATGFAYVGPILLLMAILATGVACVTGFHGTLVKDKVTRKTN